LRAGDSESYQILRGETSIDKALALAHYSTIKCHVTRRLSTCFICFNVRIRRLCNSRSSPSALDDGSQGPHQKTLYIMQSA